MTESASKAPEALAAFLRDGRLFHRAGPSARRVQIALYHLIAEGVPVTLDALAAAVGLGRNEVADILGAIPASNFQRDEADRILGFRGLTQIPSRHRLILTGPTRAAPVLYAWCAFDCLFLPALLNGAVAVASTCPVTQAGIALTVTPTRVRDIQPETTAMSFVTPDALGMRADLRGAFCRHVNFFASAHAGEAWRADNPDAAVISLDQGFDLGRIRNETTFGDII